VAKRSDPWTIAPVSFVSIQSRQEFLTSVEQDAGEDFW
jgi:hypothetical protein